MTTFRVTSTLLGALLVAACGDSGSQATVTLEPVVTAKGCARFTDGATATPATIGTCVNCEVTDEINVIDGNLNSAARMTGSGTVQGGMRITALDRSIHPAGTLAGFVMTLARPGVAANPFAFIRTYRQGVLQEESTLSARSGVGAAAPTIGSSAEFFGLRTTKDFDAVEFELSSAVLAGAVEVNIFEACSDFSAISEPVPIEAPPSRTAVIADLSTGANPYHDVFSRPAWTQHPSTVIPGFPADAPALRLSLDDSLDVAEEKDAAIWTGIQTGVVYWIPQTNLLYVRTRHTDEAFPGTERELPYATANHGTLTSGVIARECRDCYLLIVSDPEGGFTFSLDYLAQHANWVDVAASTQQAAVIAPTALPEAANALVLSQLSGPFSPYTQAARQWVEAGRLYFVGSGNYPTSLVGYPIPTPSGDRTIPPWFTVIGGSYSECRGTELNAGKPAEFSSEYHAVAPANDSSSEYQDVSGTSFSTPLVATHVAQALKRVRTVLGDTRGTGTYWSGTPRGSGYLMDGELSREDIFAAFTDAADLFVSDQYTGPCGSNGVPSSPQPWVEMGWGHVGRAQGSLAADIILGVLQAPAKPVEQRRYMDAYMAARRASVTASP